MILAKEILGYGYVRNTKYNWKQHDPRYYSADKLGEILKNDNEKTFDDPGELEIRDSFDFFIVFLGKIGYSLKVGALKRHEILFFNYYIDKATKNNAVEQYTTTNEFPLYRILVGEYRKYLTFGRLTKWGRYKNEFERVRTYPPDGALGVPTDVSIAVIFSEPVSVEPNSLTLRDNNSKPIQGTTTLSRDGKTLKFKSSSLAGSTTYTATINGVKNLGGKAKSISRTWKFTTAQ
jgi:hypothetical protein